MNPPEPSGAPPSTSGERAWSPDRPLRDDYLVFGSPQILQEDIDEVVDSLRSGWIGSGPKVLAFEKAFGEYIGVPHTVAVHSCTAALHLAMVAISLEPGDEVIVPSMTFAATGNAVLHAGATPVLADVRRETMCLDVEDAARKVTPRTRAIIPVHFAGRPCEMDAILELARRHGLKVIGDCAHAIETRYRGHTVGTLGDLNTYSFYVTKNLATAEGGMVATANQEWADRIKVLALHGLSADAWKRFTDEGFKHYEVVELGFKYNMTDLQAALGLRQLRRIEKNLVRRQEIWKRYDEAFADLPVVLPAPEEPNTRHARHLYTLMLEVERLRAARDEVLQMLHRQNIGTGIHYRALHLHRYYRERFGYAPGDLPVSEWITERTLSLPLSAKLTDRDVDDVITAVRNTLRHVTR